MVLFPVATLLSVDGKQNNNAMFFNKYKYNFF